jgi:L-2-hydroxyglutarate oxidase
LPEHDFAVVGAGIVGLAVARELLVRRPEARVVVHESEHQLALHQSGNNSGVVHAGLYYAPGSLKARLCREGRAALLRYADERGIPCRALGKLVVATSEAELPALAELERRGTENGLQGLRGVGPAEMREIEPHVRGVRALHVPETASIDFAEVTREYARDVAERGGELRLGSEVEDVDELDAGRVVVCAGAAAARLAPHGLRTVPFRGDYFVLSERAAALVRGHVYPVPDPRFPFLGVHFSRRVDDTVWAGPNAVPVPGRGLASREMLRLARRYWRTGAGELHRAASTGAALRAMRRYLPELRREDLVRGPSGVRAQAVDAEGGLVDDFVFAREGRVLHVLNAPSPAATASLAIAAHVVDQL